MIRKTIPAKIMPPYTKIGGAVSRASKFIPFILSSAAVRTGEAMIMTAKANFVFS